MTRIAIVDENPSIARQLKHVLEQAGHQATLCRGFTPEPSQTAGGGPDLVLIGQRSHDADGWVCFNQWKETTPDLPLMLYVLDDCRTERMGVLVKAVNQAARGLMSRSPNLPQMRAATVTDQ